MTSYKIKSKFLGSSKPEQALTSGDKSTSLKMDTLLRARNSVNNSSGSSIKSTSSESSSNLSASELLNVKIIFPNGLETVKKIESKKAIYDLLIELSASAKLIPTNYMLKLYSQDENNNNIYDDDKLIEYTPNQTIGQLNPTKIKILPKTSTLKHHHALQDVNSSSKLSASIHSINSKQQQQYHYNQASTVAHSSKPFEFTRCVQVNLPFNQKTIVRAKPEIKLNDLFDLICKEANLDRNKYELVVANQTHLSMQDSFDTFDTKEVSLVLKQATNNEQSKLLNSKSTHSIYVQNSSNSNNTNYIKKSTISNQKNNQNSNRDSLLRSKSEIDIKLESNSNTMLASRISNNTPNLEKKPLDVQNVITPAKLTAKKKPAPPPPPSATTIQQNESNKSKDSAIETTTTIKQLISATKRKAPAPPPPPMSQLQPEPAKETQPSKDQLKIETAFNNPSPKSQHSCDYSSETNPQDNQKINASLSSTSSSPQLPASSNYSLPSSPASSAGSHNEKNSSSDTNTKTSKSLIMPVVKTHIHYNPTIQKYHTSMLYSSSVISPLSQTHKTNEESLKESENILSSNAIVARKLSLQSTSSDVEEEDSFENSVTSGSSSKLDKYQEVESLAEFNSLDTKSNNDKEISIHSSSLSIYNNEKSDKSIEESLLQSNLRGKFYGKLSDQKTFSEDDFSDLDSIKASNSPLVLNSKFSSLQHIQVSRYQQYLTKCEDFNTKNDSNNNNLNETIKEETLKSTSSSKRSVTSEKRPELTKLTFVNTAAEPNAYVKTKPLDKEVFRSPASPVPQFPAIGADELSEQHQNYTVVRSGEIIEKNGTYYSTDGTVRGYSGIVKKIANSKTLNEIFTKQLELEQQQHERDYQLELEQKQKQEEEVQKKMNSFDRYKQQQQQQLVNAQKRQSLPYNVNSNSKGRSSLSSIILNEKTAKSSTLSHMFKQPNQPAENELAKKLEERANKLAAKTNKPLEIDTNLKPLESTSNSSSSSSYTTNQSASSASSSSSSTNASSTVISPRSPSSNRAAYTKIYDLKNEQNKLDSTSSSSSSLSTFPYEPLKNILNPKPFNTQMKSNTFNISKTNNNIKNSKHSVDFHSMLLNEIKSVVPLVEDISSDKKAAEESNNQVMSTSSLIRLANPVVVAAATTVVKAPPPPPANPPQVAPKNFSSDAVKSLSKKAEVLNARDNLLDSIRSFSVTSLRRVDLK